MADPVAIKTAYLVRKLRAVNTYKTRTVMGQTSALRRLAADPAHQLPANPDTPEMCLLELIDIAIDSLAWRTDAIPLDGHETELSREMRSDVFGNIDEELWKALQDLYNRE